MCGGYTKNRATLNDVNEFKGPNLQCSKFPSMLKARYNCKTDVINSVLLFLFYY